MTRKPPPATQTVLDDMPLRVDDCIVWDRLDGTTAYCRITRIHRREVVMRCHCGGISWTRHQKLPLFPSMVRRPWTLAELLETTC